MRVPFNRARDLIREFKTKESRLAAWNKFLPNLFDLEADLLSDCVSDEPDTYSMNISELEIEQKRLEEKIKEVSDKMIVYKKILFDLERRLSVTELTYRTYVHCIKETLKEKRK
jgi:hypothetical protein